MQNSFSLIEKLSRKYREFPCPHILQFLLCLLYYSFMSFDKCLMTCIYCYSFIQNSFTALNVPNVLHLCILPFSCLLHPLTTTDLFTASAALPFLECHAVGILQSIACLDWFPSLSNIHVFLWLGSSFLFFYWKASHSIDISQFVFPFTDWVISWLLPSIGNYE